jgi:hypothetical protein
MATLLSDDGQVSTFLTDDGRQVQVASQFAPSLGGAPDPAAGLTPEPAPAPPPMVPEMPAIEQAPAPAWAEPPPVAPQPEPVPTFAAPEPAPTPEPVEEFAPDDFTDLRRPVIAPDASVRTPTQLAAAMLPDEQVKADAAFNAAEADAKAKEEAARLQEAAVAEAQRNEEAMLKEREQRALEEKVLNDDYRKTIQRHANFKVDPNRGISGDRQTWAWIAAAIAGFGSALKGEGDKNPALQALMSNLDKNVQLQMSERDAIAQGIGMKREALTDFRGQTKTVLGEYNLRTAAAYERAAKQADAVALRASATGDIEAAKATAAGLRQKAQMATTEAGRVEAEQRAAVRRAKAAAAAAQQKAQQADAKWRAEHKMAPDPSNPYKYEAVVDPKAALELQGLALDNKKKTGELTGVSPEAQKDTEGRTIAGLTVGGKPLVAATVDEGKKLRAMKASTQTFVNRADELRMLREDLGAEITKTGGARQMQSKVGSMMVELKEMYNAGALDQGMLDIAGKILGTNDPAEIRDYTDALMGAADDAVGRVNNFAREQDPAADRWEPTRLATAVAREKQPVQRSTSVITANPAVWNDPRDPSKGFKKGPADDDAQTKIADLETLIKRDKPSPKALIAIRKRVNDAVMPAPTKAALLARLTKAIGAAESESPEVRKLRGSVARSGQQVPVVPEGLLYGLPEIDEGDE